MHKIRSSIQTWIILALVLVILALFALGLDTFTKSKIDAISHVMRIDQLAAENSRISAALAKTGDALSLQETRAAQDQQTQQSENDVLHNKILALTGSLEESKATQAALEGQNAGLAATIKSQDCKGYEFFKPDYSNNNKMGDALRSFMGEAGNSPIDEISAADWNNPNIVLHNLTYYRDNQTFMETFVVYFGGSDSEQGVYWVNSQCWLDH